MMRTETEAVVVEMRGSGRGERLGGRIGSVNPKMLAGILIAAVGIGSLAWSIKSLQRPDRRPRMVSDRPADAPPEDSDRRGAAGGMASDERVGTAGNGPEPRIRVGPGGGADGPGGFGMPPHLRPSPVLESYTFTKVKDAAGAEAAVDEFAAGVSSTIGNDDSFAWIGLSQRERLIEAVRLSIQPLASGDASALAASIVALKGKDEGDPPASKQMYDLLSPAFQLSSFDASNVTVKGVDSGVKSPMPRRGGMAMMALRTRGPDDSEARQISIVSYGMDAFFPEAADFAETGKKAVDVRVPVRTKGSDEKAGDLDLSLVMVWNAKAQVWQPADYRLFVRNPEVGRAMMPARATATERESR